MIRKNYEQLIKIKTNITFNFIFIFLVPLFPIVQDQWLNLILLNEFEFSYYSILYFISGFIFPILVIYNSLLNFFDYKFNSNKYQNKKFKFVGYLFFINILILSIIIIRYFLYSLNYIIPQIDLNNYLDIKIKFLLLLIIMTFLLINKTKRFLKKLILLNFFIICFINWTIYFLNLQGMEIFIIKYISNNIYHEFNNIINIFYLLLFEIFYFLWSFINYQNNLSNWSITYPQRGDFIHISKIFIFYLGVLIYYFIFHQIS